MGMERIVSNEEVLADIQRVASMMNGSMSARAYKQHGGQFSSSLIETRFGSMLRAFEAAGATPGNAVATVDRVVLDVRRVMQMLDTDRPTNRPLRLEEYQAHGRFSAKTVTTLLGNWPLVLNIAAMNLGKLSTSMFPRYLPVENGEPIAAYGEHEEAMRACPLCRKSWLSPHAGHRTCPACEWDTAREKDSIAEGYEECA